MALLLGVTDLEVPWATLILSVALYIVIPLAAGIVTRLRLTRGLGVAAGEAAVTRFTAWVKPLSVTGLLATDVLLFVFKAR